MKRGLARRKGTFGEDEDDELGVGFNTCNAPLCEFGMQDGRRRERNGGEEFPAEMGRREIRVDGGWAV